MHNTKPRTLGPTALSRWKRVDLGADVVPFLLSFLFYSSILSFLFRSFSFVFFSSSGLGGLVGGGF